MPSSAQLQLIARGNQDIYLTGSPQFTFFRQVFRRYTPFAIESIPIEFDGTPDYGRRISTLIPRKADLLGALFIEVDLPPLPPTVAGVQPYWTNDIGHALIRDVSIEIGEKEIDRQTGEWLQIWGELTTPADKRDGYNDMVGHWNTFPPTALDVSQGLHLTIPLHFWFCRTIGTALPLIALQAHPVRIIIHLRPFKELWWSADISAGGCSNDPTICSTPINSVPITRFQLFGDYIYLEKEERRRFVSTEQIGVDGISRNIPTKHEYLIEQIQMAPPHAIPAGISKVNIPLSFNHCCKEFIWVIQEKRAQCNKEWFNYSSALEFDGGLPLQNPADLLESALIRLDGEDRFYRRNARYFRQTQPYQHHRTVPNSFIYLYSFSMLPESEQPSGTINCSQIDNIVLSLDLNTTTLTRERVISVFATNYNILHISGGLGGLAFIA